MIHRRYMPYAVGGAALVVAGLTGFAVAYARSRGGLGGLPLAPGVAMTLWTGGSLRRAWEEQRAAFEAVKPQIIMPYIGIDGGSDAASIIQEARATNPGLRVWVELAASAAMEYGAGPVLRTAERVVASTGAEAVVWNAERPFKTPQGARVARELVEGWAPSGIVQIHSAYSSPRGHSDYPWAAFLSGTPHCPISLAQDYPFGDSVRSGTAPVGDMQRFMDRAKQGWQAAVSDGIIDASVIRGTYVPGAHVPTQDLIAACEGIPYVGVWPWHGLYDAQVIEALRVIRGRL